MMIDDGDVGDAAAADVDVVDQSGQRSAELESSGALRISTKVET